MKRARQFHYVYRSAITGHFVAAAYAKAHPRTTVRQRLAIARKPRR